MIVTPYILPSGIMVMRRYHGNIHPMMVLVYNGFVTVEVRTRVGSWHTTQQTPVPFVPKLENGTS